MLKCWYLVVKKAAEIKNVLTREMHVESLKWLPERSLFEWVYNKYIFLTENEVRKEIYANEVVMFCYFLIYFGFQSLRRISICAEKTKVAKCTFGNKFFRRGLILITFLTNSANFNENTRRYYLSFRFLIYRAVQIFKQCWKTENRESHIRTGIF